MAQEWQEVDGALYKKFVFADFATAFEFMKRVAVVAESQSHHPDWSNSWNTVEVYLRSHDKGGSITARDHRLAAAIDEVAEPK